MHTSARYIYLGKSIYIKGITLKHSWSFAPKRFPRPGCPRALQGNWITKKAEVYSSAFLYWSGIFVRGTDSAFRAATQRFRKIQIPLSGSLADWLQ